MAHRRSSVYTSGPNVGPLYVLGALRLGARYVIYWSLQAVGVGLRTLHFPDLLDLVSAFGSLRALSTSGIPAVLHFPTSRIVFTVVCE